MDKIKSFSEALRRCSERERDPYEVEEQIEKDAKELKELKENLSKVGGYDEIPQLCFVDKGNDVGIRWKELARHLHEKELYNQTWDEETLYVLWNGLSELVNDPTIDGVSYQEFKTVGEKVVNQIYNSGPCSDDSTDTDFRTRLLEARGVTVMSASHFLLLSTRFSDDKGRIPVKNIFDFYRQLAYITRTESEIFHYSCGRPFLTEDNIEHYVTTLLSGDVQTFKQIPEDRLPYDSCVITKRFLHQLDLGKRKRVRVEDFMNSQLLRELIRVQMSSDVEFEWLESQETIYRRYLSWMDSDIGVITPESLKELIIHYTDLFIDRVFEVMGVSCLTYTNFVIFQLVCEDLSSDGSFSFLWKALDLHGNGEVTPVVIHAFLKQLPSIRETVREQQSKLESSSLIESLAFEIFDIVNPKQPFCIRQDDLRECGLRGTVFRILFMTVGFELHEMKSAEPDKFKESPQQKPPKKFQIPTFVTP
eukprot:TRINITY_DN24870_c0_g1_i1.p1 TRINITY_DN24870_c0_g1~~TRINITY_DN24870_c0_g1_i1.p1  ORF type:complete len:477 (+),score=106.03 TRINITY_DN24870_c0_g1_i1:46-1476(+)